MVPQGSGLPPLLLILYRNKFLAEMRGLFEDRTSVHMMLHRMQMTKKDKKKIYGIMDRVVEKERHETELMEDQMYVSEERKWSGALHHR